MEKLKYWTTYKKIESVEYVGEIFAYTDKEAEEIAKERGLGEIVISKGMKIK